MDTVQSYFNLYVVRGGVCMIALVPLSVYTLGLVIQSYISLRQSRVAHRGVVLAAKAIASAADYAAFRQNLAAHHSALARIALAYLDAAERGQPSHPDDNSRPIEDETDRLYQSLSPLVTSYIIAPLIGVLGTTIGIIRTFEQFATEGRRDMTALVRAIDVALITTMWGLFIAVPAYFFNALLQARIFRYERDVLPAAAREILKACAPFIAPRRSAADSPVPRLPAPPALAAETAHPGHE